MRIVEQASQVIEQLKQAASDTEVEAVVIAFAESTANNKVYSEELEALIESVSPLECTSQQWRNFRIARITLGRLDLLEEAQAR